MTKPKENVTTTLMKDLDSDPKLKAILTSAWMAFSTYGYRKTSMDDIARGAAMSRPALYLHFKNKESIFRALVEAYYADTVQTVAEILEANTEPNRALSRAFAAQGGEAAEAMMASPHGMELLDAGVSVAADIVEIGEGQLRDVYANWLSGMEKSGLITLEEPPQDVAKAFCAALKGVKMTAPDYATYAKTIQVLARMFGAGLVPH